MKKYVFLLPVFFALITVSACAKPDRAAADKKFTTACVAALKVISSEGAEFEVTKSVYSDVKDSRSGDTLREVLLTARYYAGDGDIDVNTYTCRFQEHVTWKGYYAEFFNLEADGRKYGNFDGTVEGDYADMININDAVDKVLKPRS